MVAEITVLDLTAQRLAFINPTKAMECLLLALLTNMPRLLQLEDLEHLLFMGVIVLWVEAWATMVVLDRLSQLKLPKVLLVAVPSVEDMIHLLAEVRTQVRTNTTTTPIKATNLVLVMT
jgi:hypothetical protein